MQYSELAPDSIFRFAHDTEAGFNWMKLTDRTFMDLTDRSTVSWEDEIFDGLSDQVEVEEWDPAVSDVIDEVFDFDDEDEISLVESDYFPDYELIAAAGDEVLPNFTIHCWQTEEDPDLHQTSLWYCHEHVMDAPRWVIEKIMGIGVEPLEYLFGPVR